eukprot:sb/3461697/
MNRSKSRHKKVKCRRCNKFVRSASINRHLLTHNIKIECPTCKRNVREDRFFNHRVLCHDHLDESLCNRVTGVHEHMDKSDCSSVNGFFNSYELRFSSSEDYDSIFEKACSTARPIVQAAVQRHPVKCQLTVSLSFYKDSDGQRKESEKVFRSHCEPLLVGDNVDGFFQRAQIILRHSVEVYERHGSGWNFDQHKCSKLEIAKYSPLEGSGFVAISKKLSNMRSTLNITSNDNRCFLYCILAHLFPVEKTSNPNRHTSYKKYEAGNHVDKNGNTRNFNMGGVKFPVQLNDIPKVERLNQLSISVFQWCEGEFGQEYVIPLKHGTGVGEQIDLLYIDDEDTSHFMLIKDFNAFMRHRTKHRQSMFYCRKCLHGFVAQDKQEQHSVFCMQGLNQIPVMPKPGFIEFDAEHKQDKKLFRIYYDFECLTVPYSTCMPESSSTTLVQKHIPCGFAIVAVSEFKEFKEEPVVFSHPDPAVVSKTFITELSRIHDNMMECYDKNQHPIDMTEDDELEFQASLFCHICHKGLDWKSKSNYPVRDHDHTKKTNNFRGAACNKCNLNFFNRTKKVPAIAHNMKGYDLNLFLRDLVRFCQEDDERDADLESPNIPPISLIPENLEKIKAVFTDKFTFLDSFAFLSTSLDRLASNLKKSGIDKFPSLKKQFPEKCELLAEKGVFFYDYATAFSVFEEKDLPPKEAFYSQLSESHISEKDYQRAQDVYKAMECRNLLDYMHLYVLTDTLQLCDVFENFRSLCLEAHGLDPCHYVSLPAFAWDAMLRMTKVKLEVLTDIEMYTFLEKALRGGVTTVNHRHAKANNKYLDDFNPEDPISFINYIDANNLYGASMKNKMPTKNFKWLSQEEIDSIDIQKLDPEGDKCYIFEVDLDYPDHLHDSHTDYPLAVEGKLVEEALLSEYNKQFLEQHGEVFSSSRKLIPDLFAKERYTCSALAEKSTAVLEARACVDKDPQSSYC